MDSTNDSKLIIKLLVKEISEDLTNAEAKQLNKWINASSYNRELYQKFHSKEYAEQRFEILDWFDAKQAWPEVLKEIEPRKTKLIPSVVWQTVGLAASILLLIGIFYYFNKQKTDPVITQNKYEIKPGTSQAILTLADGHKIKLLNLDTTILDFGTGISINSKEISYTSASKLKDKGTTFNILETPRGGEYILTLFDGTKVWLNSESKLQYPEIFEDDNRTVYVEGEAYFEVAEDESRPFYVKFNDNTIKVLGTRFNVRAYNDNDITSITLSEGSIELKTKNLVKILKPDEQAIINSKTDKIDIVQADSELYTAWKDGKFMYRNATLEYILNDLSKWYNTNLYYTDENVKNLEFSVYMNRQDYIRKVLEMLEATGEIGFKIEGNNIIISPKGTRN